MAFKIYKNDVADIPAYEYLPCDDITVKTGDALVLSSGHLVLATGTVRPQYLSMKSTTVPTDGTKIPVIRITESMELECPLSAASASIAIGTKYTISATADSITATSDGGTASVISFDGKNQGDLVRVRFLEPAVIIEEEDDNV